MSVESVMPSNHLILCCPLLFLPSIFPSIRESFPMSQFFTSDGRSIGQRCSFSISPYNEYSRLTGWISLQSKGLSRVFSNTTIQKHHSLVLSFLYGPTLTSIQDYWKNHSFASFASKVMPLLFSMLPRLVIAFFPRNKSL